ncbi:transcriptional activator NhaR [Motiliproteus sp. SC1-56]|uniref:transcriptional activator NhaR n=1 Tax=Motiliproteus sp. SC1-56 TaxID=2799565 RepID=UPI001F5E3336|nr:transcriptional activator NhaR [Motiliproteus sp. SC1-56]
MLKRIDVNAHRHATERKPSGQGRMNNLRINLKHLRYFWTVASAGSITRASETLCLTPQTISGQVRELELQIGSKLFRKDGRNLALTDIGQTVFSYADEMFAIGLELQDLLAGSSGTTQSLRVGIAMVVPKLLAYRVLEPVLQLKPPVQLLCHEAPLVDLLAELAVHKLDIVIADSQLNPTFNVKAYNHLLGESTISFFATPKLTQELKADFPASLDGTPMLMPSNGSNLRRDLDSWLEKRSLKPVIAAEFDDRALMKAFGERGAGVFSSPTAVEKDVLDKYGVEVIGRTDDLVERFYVISAEKRIKHPAVSVITQSARHWLES